MGRKIMRYSLLDVGENAAKAFAVAIKAEDPRIVVFVEESSSGVWSVRWWGTGSDAVRRRLEGYGFALQVVQPWGEA